MMAEKHPYLTSSGGFIQVVNHLRNSFPSSLTSDTIKKLGYAPKNETYIINTLRFIDIIDKDGNKTANAAKVFSMHKDEDFQKAFGQLIRAAYKDLFTLYSDKTWLLDISQLITFFRQNDQSSGIVGKRQANTFIALSALSGNRDLPGIKGQYKADKKSKVEITEKKTKQSNLGPKQVNSPIEGEDRTKQRYRDVGLTVRIEINLPAEGSQEIYDRIFKSIRENLLNE